MGRVQNFVIKTGWFGRFWSSLHWILISKHSGPSSSCNCWLRLMHIAIIFAFALSKSADSSCSSFLALLLSSITILNGYLGKAGSWSFEPTYQPNPSGNLSTKSFMYLINQILPVTYQQNPSGNLSTNKIIQVTQ